MNILAPNTVQEGVVLLQVPADLQMLVDGVREITIWSSLSLYAVPEWRDKLAHLEALTIESPETAVDIREGGLPSEMVLLASLAGPGLKYLSLKNFRQWEVLPETIRRLTSLETLHIVGFCGLRALPEWLDELVHLKTLVLDGGQQERLEYPVGNIVLMELPASLSDLVVLKHLSIHNFESLGALPANFGRLTSLENLHIDSCFALQLLPSFDDTPPLTSLTLEFCCFRELPCFARLTLLRKLTLRSLREVTNVSMSIDTLTGLQELTIQECDGIDELQATLHEFTRLTTLVLKEKELCTSAESLKRLCNITWTKLACSLPTLCLLQRLELYGGHTIGAMVEEDVCALGRSLRAWPLLFLDLTRTHSFQSCIDLGRCWQELGLPPAAAYWDDAMILQHWRVQQQKVAAFANGAHPRMGAASQMSVLNDAAVGLIADAVLGGWSLLEMWNRERQEREALSLRLLDPR